MKQKNEQPENQDKEHRFDPELLKQGLRRDLDQYEMLKRCSEKEDMTEWNEWRKENKKEDIYLEGADFQHAYLNGVLLDENPVQYYGKVYLKNAVFRFSKLMEAKLFRAYLEQADFYHADLTKTYVQLANLKGADFSHTILKGTQMPFSIVDGATVFLKCEIDKSTWMHGVALDNVRIEQGLKQLLKYNIRRIFWEDWYKGSPRNEPLWWENELSYKRHIRQVKAVIQFFKTSPARLFWSFSNYGLSTWRIIGWFLGLAFAFAIIYYACGLLAYPGIVSNLFVIEGTQGPETIASWLVPLRAVYFSIVTMTTLGFGDMYANAQSIWGHILLTIQVILGYVLLGALITRFAVLFTAGGPAGKFEDGKKEKRKKEEKQK